jgi:DNA repair exonuclease SbcCD ATPase subunit
MILQLQENLARSEKRIVAISKKRKPMNEKTQELSKIEMMSEQIKELFKKSEEAYDRKQQKKRDQQFFAWFEITFGIEKYEQIIFNGNSAAFVDDFIMFVCKSFEEISAEVYAKCNVCKEQGLYSIGIVKNLADLGECLSLYKEENYYIGCGIHELFPTKNTDLSSAGEMEAVN